MENKIFSKVDQVGIVVKDIDKTINYLTSLGIGPFSELPGNPFGDRKLFGKPANYRMKIRVAQLGPVQIELLQPLEGQCLQKEFLETRGEGIHHVGFYVKNIEERLAELKEQGINIIASGKGPNKGGFAYLDTEKHCGIVFEIIEWDM